MKLVPFGVMVAVGDVAGAKKNSVGGGRAITVASGALVLRFFKQVFVAVIVHRLDGVIRSIVWANHVAAQLIQQDA